MRAIAVTTPGKVEIVQLSQPQPGPYQVLVKTEVAFLCNATDGKLISGHFPGVDSYPLVLGHESAGIVEAVGSKVRNFELGDRVIGGLVFDFKESQYGSGWGGFCDYTLANDHDAMVEDGVADEEHGWFECYEIQRKVESDISPEAAALLCTWREVYGGFGDFKLQAGDAIVIFGAGPVGLSFLTFGKLLGLGPIAVVDPLECKRKKAMDMGADVVFAPDDPMINELPKRFGRKLDAVIDAVGNEKIINQGLPLIKMGGSICVYGVLAQPTITLDKSTAPYNFNLYVHQWPTRHLERAAQEPICQWIREGKLYPIDFISHEFRMEQVNEALDVVRSGKAIKVLLRY